MRSASERLEYCQEWKKRLDRSYNDLKQKREKALKFRDADPSIVQVIENRSKITTTDLQDAIDMAKPDILETIAGIDEPLKLDPDEARFVDPVKKLQVLGNVMVKRKNRWFRICSDFLDDSMVLQFGCIKYQWAEETTRTEKIYENLTEEELQALLEKPEAKVTEDAFSEDATTRTTKIAYSLKDEFVKYYGVPSERIKFPLDSRDFDTVPFVIEEVCLYEHEFIKMYGEKFFKKVKDDVALLEKGKPDSEFEKRFKHLGGIDHLYDQKTNKYKAYECYFWEGEKPWMLTYAGDHVAEGSDVENKYGKPPYRGGSPFLIAHSLIGKGYLDALQEIQRERTNLKRQITDIIMQNSFRRNFVDINGSGMNISDYENNSAMNALIRCEPTMPLSQCIMPEPKIQLGADMLQYWELLQNEKDAHIPTPRSFSGLEGAKDERTYRGKQLKVNQASKKLLMMLRGYMEEVFGPLFQDTLDCIAKFMKKKTVVRYLNEDYDIQPEDIICKYALIVNVGLGAHDKQDLIVKLQQLIGLALQEMATGIVTPQNLFYMNQELVKAMGFLNTMDFVTDPKLKEAVTQLIQILTMLLPLVPPESQEVVMQAIQQAKAAVGIKEEPQQGKGGQNAQGTQAGEQPAEIPLQPENVFNPQTAITGNGFFA